MSTQEQIDKIASDNGLSPSENSLINSDLIISSDNKPPKHIIYDASNFTQWMRDFICMRCRHRESKVCNIYGEYTVSKMEYPSAIMVDRWAILPLCSSCANKETDLHQSIVEWFVMAWRYRDDTGDNVPPLIHLAMIKLLTETLGCEAKFEVKS